MEEAFPKPELQRYREATLKFQRIQRFVLKINYEERVSKLAEEFQQLANDFSNSYLPQYAGLCWMRTAECHKALGNNLAQVDFLLRSARASIAADRSECQIGFSSNDRTNLQAALQAFSQALACLDEDSVMRAAIIRELKKIQPHSEATSGFVSPAHRIRDLEVSANESVRCGDFVAALEKRTEIFDNIVERKMQLFYVDVLKCNEITRILLLLLLELPPCRQSPSHIKLIEMFSVTNNEEQQAVSPVSLKLPKDLVLAIQLLVATCKHKRATHLSSAIDRMNSFRSLTAEHRLILEKLKTNNSS